MSSECTHDCSSCSSNCSSKNQIVKEKPNDLSRIKHIIGIVSGKGGVGKSLVTSELAVLLKRKGYKVGILDADITGPSIPNAFGITQKAAGSELGIYPATSKTGIEIMSINMLLDDPTMPVVWRGSMISGAVKQFYTDVIWDVDYLLVDMPPGTGDVPLTVFQSLPLDGIIIVSSPQGLVNMIVEKAINMANTMNVKVLGIVENMSFIKCPDCGRIINLFGDSQIDKIAKKFGIAANTRLPINPDIAKAVDQGLIEEINIDELEIISSMLEIIDTKQ